MSNIHSHLMEDSDDEGLKAIMGNHFQDHTIAAPKNASSVKKTAADKKCVDTRKPEDSKAMDSEWSECPTYAPNFYSKLKLCGKYALVAGGLIVLFWYWNLTGQMATSAAIPCMVVCGTYGGFKIGNVCRE